MPFSPTLTALSLGGGVQSSFMALMAGEGAFDRVPDCAIFADTRWEPPSLYDHINWLKDRLSFPLYVVVNGRSLREDVKALTNHSGSSNYVDIPVYLKGRNGESDGIGRRQCTDNYRIRPIRRWNARPASPAHSSPANAGWRRSSGGQSCSSRRWRSTLG